MSIDEIYRIFKECSGVTTDSRSTKENNLFFGLKGDKFNGNEYARKAIENGAKYAIIDEKTHDVDNRYILVKNSLETLQKLSNLHRKKSNVKVIGITGSNGKTTSKELINIVLSTKYKTCFTIGNLNNHIGVPLTLLNLTKDSEIAIIEMGANHIGEINLLCNICDPDYGYITNFGKAHLEGFIDMNGVIKGKKELYDYIISKNGMIFLDNDNAKQKEIIKEYSNVYSFGKSSGDILYNVCTTQPNINIDIENITIKSSLFGNHNIENIMAAVTIGRYFKIDYEKIKNEISNYISSNNRSQIIIKGSNKIILDAYNANPTSMILAIKYFEKLNKKNKILILGDMFELGKNWLKYHQEISDYCKTFKKEKIYLIGELFLKTEKNKNFDYYKNIDELIKENKLSNIFDSHILIKGSRGVKLEKLIQYIG
ncbi:MAG: UDP-N-acetylmuramoyl-tripeptide--D-alanyl-D-alanine ligase [Flavobacteriaceae bacterium]|nr:UDP-N-acetylmuramoyl-tripeptide--D-alanyl-D-alanine ligase [Flavobacteriaceae bacterium]|tara:strand:- start:11274 stop:12554 length:1281 start_codon:yes stop_codon:yes gene_type:complete